MTRGWLVLALGMWVVPAAAQEPTPQIDAASGLVIAPGWEVVRAQCTACHSSKLITQNRATRKGWLDAIRWMQATQKLWHLGANEPVILDYLSRHYGVPDRYQRMRRQPLSVHELPPSPARD